MSVERFSSVGRCSNRFFRGMLGYGKSSWFLHGTPHRNQLVRASDCKLARYTNMHITCSLPASIIIEVSSLMVVKCNG